MTACRSNPARFRDHCHCFGRCSRSFNLQSDPRGSISGRTNGDLGWLSPGDSAGTDCLACARWCYGRSRHASFKARCSPSFCSGEASSSLCGSTGSKRSQSTGSCFWSNVLVMPSNHHWSYARLSRLRGSLPPFGCSNLPSR